MSRQGKKIGKYEVVRKLGQGASSIVFLCHDPFAQRDVAIKVVTPQALKDPMRGRLYTHLFMNEASLVGKLAHPHIVQLYDAQVADEQCYIVMEYVPGGTLEGSCGANRLLPVSRIVEICFKCTRALDFAHRLGITHRDIKPANILIVTAGAQTGDIKISDFGAAITRDPKSAELSAIGSPAYMSPEQLKELPLDHRTDIYSLGVVMYQLLTGSLPFQAKDNYGMVDLILNATLTPPNELREGIPTTVTTIVAKAMTKDRDQRYQTWAEFAHDLSLAFRNNETKAPIYEFAESEKFDTLRTLLFFNKFSDIAIWEVVRASEWRTLAPGDKIEEDEANGDFCCFLAEGELKVSKGGKIHNLLTTGDCFGTLPVIANGMQLSGTQLVALTKSKVITLHDTSLEHTSESCRMHFYQSFLELLANRLANPTTPSGC